MPASWTDPFVGDPKQAIAELFARTLENAACHIGAAAPGAASDGWLWLDTSDPDFYVLKVKSKTEAGATRWVAIATERLSASLNGDPDPTDTRTGCLEFLGFRAENEDQANFPAAGPGTPGLVYYRTNDGKIVFFTGTELNEVLSVRDGLDYDTVEVLPNALHLDGANPPTADAVGTLQGYLFDDVAETMHVPVKVPNNWDGVSDLIWRIHQGLKGAQNDNDLIEWDISWRALTKGADKAGKAATTPASPAVQTDIGVAADAKAAGGYHTSDLVLDHDDDTNPISPGDWLLLSFNRATVGGAGKVGGVVVGFFELLFIQKAAHQRAVV